MHREKVIINFNEQVNVYLKPNSITKFNEAIVFVYKIAVSIVVKIYKKVMKYTLLHMYSE